MVISCRDFLVPPRCPGRVDFSPSRHSNNVPDVHLILADRAFFTPRLRCGRLLDSAAPCFPSNPTVSDAVFLLYSGTVKCSKALPILRKAQAASKTALLANLTPQKRQRESFAALQNKKKASASASRRGGRNSGGGGRAAAAASAETTKRRTRSIDASRGGGSRGTARWLGGDSVRRRGGTAVSGGLRGVMEGGDSESDDEEEEDEVVFSDEDSRDSEWSSSETGEGGWGREACSTV